MVTSAEERRAGAPARPRPEDAEATPAASGPVVAREERNRARQLWAVRGGAVQPCAERSRAPSGAPGTRLAYSGRPPAAERPRPSRPVQCRVPLRQRGVRSGQRGGRQPDVPET